MQILVEGTWYERSGRTGVWEREFEALVLQEAAHLFPGFDAVQFKFLVYSDDGAARPDLALVHKRLVEWWVVEIELGSHSLHGHVLPQIGTLQRGLYTSAHADRLAEQVNSHHRRAVRDLIKGEPPRVLVVADSYDAVWQQEIESVGARLAIFELFESAELRYLYRFEGFRPSVDADVVSSCRVDPSLPWLIRIDSPGAVAVRRNEAVTIEVGEESVLFERIDASDAVWLHPRQPLRLPRDRELQLVRLGDGRLRLVTNEES